MLVKSYNGFYSGHDLRSLLRAGRSDEEISTTLAQLWRGRGDRYSELRSSHMPQDGATPQPAKKKVEMSYIGG